MAKYGRGLNRETVAAVNRGELSESLRTAERSLADGGAGWKPAEKPVLVTLANAAIDSHSPTFRKYFRSTGGGTVH